MMLLGAKSTLAVLAVWAVGLGVTLLLFPVSLILVAVGLPAVLAYSVCWFVYIPLEKHIFKPYEAGQRGE